VRELFLFDSLYSNVEEVFEWLRKDRSRKLINLYFRDKPRARSRELMARLRGAGIAYKDLTHADLKTGKFGRKDLYRKRVIFIETELGHSGCTNKFFNFRDYLYASCLHRYHSSDWFEKKGLERFD